jgi:hypothetical protein
MTAISDATVEPTVAPKSDTLRNGLIVALAVAFVLMFVAVASGGHRVGDGSTDHLSSYVTGDQSFVPSTSEYLQDH